MTVREILAIENPGAPFYYERFDSACVGKGTTARVSAGTKSSPDSHRLRQSNEAGLSRRHDHGEY